MTGYCEKHKCDCGIFFDVDGNWILDCPYCKEEKIEQLEAWKNQRWISVPKHMKAVLDNALELLKEQKAKPPIHIHEEYSEHDWERKKNGDIDTFALAFDYHNGPMCKRCYYSFCIHCNPNGWNRKPCVIDEYKCPKCGGYITKRTKFCCGCGQEVKWNESDDNA